MIATFVGNKELKMLLMFLIALALLSPAYANFDRSLTIVNGNYVFGAKAIAPYVDSSKAVSPVSKKVILIEGTEDVTDESSSRVIRKFSDKSINRYINDKESRTTNSEGSTYKLDQGVDSSGEYIFKITQKTSSTELKPVLIPLTIDLTPPDSPKLNELYVREGNVIIDNKYTTANRFWLSLEVEAYSHIHYFSYTDQQNIDGAFDDLDYNNKAAIEALLGHEISNFPLSAGDDGDHDSIGDPSTYSFSGQNKIILDRDDLGAFDLPDTGCTTVVVIVHDVVDNAGVGKFTVCRDAEPPNVTTKVPEEGEVIGDLESEIYFVVEDNAQVNESSIEFEVQVDSPDNPSLKYTCESEEVNCIPLDEQNKRIKVEFNGERVYGTYTIRVRANDLMNNWMEYEDSEYSFEVRSDVPRRLMFELDNYQYYGDENKYYTNVPMPSVNLHFDLDKDVDVTFMTLSIRRDRSGASHNIPSDEVLANLKKKLDDNPDNNQFILDFDDLILDFDDLLPASIIDTPRGSTEKSVVKARKIVNESGYGPDATFRPQFVVDTIYPIMSDESMSHIVGFGSNNIKFKFVEDYIYFINVKYYDDFEGETINRNATMDPSGPGGLITSAIFVMNVTTESERRFDLNVTICDKAMNCWLYFVDVFADSLPPDVWDTYADDKDGYWIQSESERFILNASDKHGEYSSGLKEIRYCYAELDGICDPTDGYKYVQPFYFNIDTKSLIRYVAYDNADNPSEIGEVRVAIDNTDPESYVELEEGWYNTPKITVNLTEYDATSYVDRSLYCMTEQCDPCAASNVYESQLEFFNEGKNIFNFCSIDAADNRQKVNLTFGLDRTMPEFYVMNVDAANEDLGVIYDEESGFYYTGDSQVHLRLKYNDDELSPLQSAGVEGGMTLPLEGTPESDEVVVNAFIEDGDNQITAYLTDQAGNTGYTSINVRSDDEGPVVTFLEPNVAFYEPKITLTSNDESMQPLIMIETDEPASCEIEYLPAGLVDVVNQSFSSSNKIIHSLKLNYKLREGSNPMTLTCKDTMGNTAVYEIALVLDFLPPTITIWESTAGIVMKGETMPNVHSYVIIDNFVTQLHVKTNELARCKYSLAEQQFANMENTFGESFAQDMLSDVLELQDNTTSLYYINCEDAAGNVATFSTTYDWVGVKVNVQLNLPITIINLRPSGYTNKMPPELKLEWETRREAQCSIDRNYDGTTWALFDFLLDAFDFAVSVDPLTERTDVYKYEYYIDEVMDEDTLYKYDITCYDPDGRLDPGFAQTSFKIKTSMDPPTILIPEYDGKMYNHSEIYVYGHCENNSNIRIFMNVYNPTEANFVDLTKCENGEYTSSDLVIREGNNTIFVESSDEAGNIEYAQRTVFFRAYGPNVSIEIDPKGGTLNKLYNVTVNIRELSISTNYSKRLDFFNSVFKVERMEDDEDIAESVEVIEENQNRSVYKTNEGTVIKQRLDEVHYRITFVPDAVPYKEAGTYIIKMIPRNFKGEDGIPGQVVFVLDPFAAAVEWLTPVESRVGPPLPVKFSGYTEPKADSAVLIIEEYGYSPKQQNVRQIAVPVQRYFDPIERIEKGYFEIDIDIVEGLNIYKMKTMLFNHTATTPDSPLYYDVVGPRVIGEMVRIESEEGTGPSEESLIEQNLSTECWPGAGLPLKCLIVPSGYYIQVQNVKQPAYFESDEMEVYAGVYRYQDRKFGPWRSLQTYVSVWPSSEAALEGDMSEVLAEYYTTSYKGYPILLLFDEFDQGVLMAKWQSQNIVVSIMGDHYSTIKMVDAYLEKYPPTMNAKPMANGDDNDGMSPVYETEYGLDLTRNDAFEDKDSDGAINYLEANADLDSSNPDTDGDDLPDGFEMDYGLSPTNPEGNHGKYGDPDADQLNNYMEYQKKTDPNNPDTDGDNVMDGPDLYPTDSSRSSNLD